ncbi:MAG: flagellar hook-associated protein FlgK [Eubacteriales bacterium]|nr:flagellar hook-associated protein FlgK [Eubacteriales bacterium]
MRPTFLAFQTASRALAASQSLIDVTGNNIANVNTNGYTRQRVDLASISNSGYAEKYTVPGATVGLGVNVTGIGQIRDPFLDARFRAQASESAQYDTLLKGLSDLEGVFDEVETEGLQAELSNFINQLHTLSQTPSSKDIALVARTAAQKVTQMLNVYSDQTEQVRSQQIYDLSKVVIDTDFNTLVKNIADLNAQIRDELTHGNEPNELFDKRNVLIDELSNIVNIKVTTSPERISEDLTIENLHIAIQDPDGGPAIGIVQNGLYNTLSASLNGDNKMIIEINSSFGGYNGEITSQFSGGSISGYLDLINGKGTYANTTTIPSENTFRGTLYYKNAIDTFAKNFAKVLNELNDATPTDDATGNPLFMAQGDTNPETDPDEITAANITISAKWLEDSTYIKTTNVVLPAGGGDNILRMISALGSDLSFHRDANDALPVMFEGTMNEYMTGLIGELSLDVELNRNFADTAATVSNNLYASRESMSGVSLDEEGINLMAYQKTYNAAARYFNVLDEAVDKIINGMGLVGR